MRRAGGEIVEVHGGHIVRSTGRKDRHSKVCTAKGPRDRRVRLSASTAIQFYDVQDRLGFDRPSKAVDWLIKKAKAAIDKLAELPAWKPTATAVPPSDGLQQQEQTSEGSQYQMSMNQSVTALMGQDDEIYPTLNGLQQQNKQISENHQLSSSSFPSRVENIKSFLPTGQTSLSFINFQSFPQNLIPRTSGSLNQDLQLSLQSYHNPVLFQQHQSYHEQQEQAMFSGPTQLGFDGSSSAGGWSSESEHHHLPSEIGLFQKILAWNADDDVSGSSIGGGGSGGSGGGFQFCSPPSMQLHILQPLGPKNQFFLQRGPLQSSDTPSIRAWIDPGINPDHHQINPPAIHHLPELPLSGFSLGGFSGYQIQARIQGDQEERDGIQNQPSSASSASYH